MTIQNHEHYEILLMKAIDDRLSSLEQRELDDHIKNCYDCRVELHDFRAIKRDTDQLRQRILKDAQIEAFRESSVVKASNYLGFTLILLGSLVLIAFAVYSFFLDEKIPLIIKASEGVIGSGALFLLAYILRVRLRGIKHDPYTEIEL